MENSGKMLWLMLIAQELDKCETEGDVVSVVNQATYRVRWLKDMKEMALGKFHPSAQAMLLSVFPSEVLVRLPDEKTPSDGRDGQGG